MRLHYVYGVSNWIMFHVFSICIQHPNNPCWKYNNLFLGRTSYIEQYREYSIPFVGSYADCSAYNISSHIDFMAINKNVFNFIIKLVHLYHKFTLYAYCMKKILQFTTYRMHWYYTYVLYVHAMTIYMATNNHVVWSFVFMFHLWVLMYAYGVIGVWRSKETKKTAREGRYCAHNLS